jgi:hypothetical protein
MNRILQQEGELKGQREKEMWKEKEKEKEKEKIALPELPQEREEPRQVLEESFLMSNIQQHDLDC